MLVVIIRMRFNASNIHPFALCADRNYDPGQRSMLLCSDRFEINIVVTMTEYY